MPPADEWSQLQLLEQTVTDRLRRMLTGVVNVEAVKAAARVTIVLPGLFAFASAVLGSAQTSLSAAFGSFALLVLVEFVGLRRTRLVAYAGLPPAEPV